MFDFPNSPTNGQQVTGPGGARFQWDGTKWVIVAVTGGSGSTTTIADTPPTSPTVGSGWWDSTDGNLFLWYSDPTGPSQWVPATNIPGPVGPTGSTGAAGATGPAGVDGFGRNIVHNSMFNIVQRGTGPWTTAGNALDRWKLWVGYDTVVLIRQAMSDADRAAIGDESARFFLLNQFTGSANADALTQVYQHIEGVRRLAGKTVTISLWAVADAGTPNLGISYDQVFGTGGSPSAMVSGAGQAVTISTTWTRYNVTFAIPSVSGKTFGTNGDDSMTVNIFYSTGTNNATRTGNIGVQSGTIRIWGVQLEVGTTLTPLEKPDPRYELATCQRYYQIGYASLSFYGVAGWGYGVSVAFPTVMRVTPTMNIIGTPSYTGASNAQLFGSQPGFYNFSAQSTGTGNWTCSFQWNAAADF